LPQRNVVVYQCTLSIKIDWNFQYTLSTASFCCMKIMVMILATTYYVNYLL